MPSTLINRNVLAAGKRTSIRLEPEFWRALHVIATTELKTVNQVVTEAETTDGSRTGDVRVYVLEWFRQRSTGAFDLLVECRRHVAEHRDMLASGDCGPRTSWAEKIDAADGVIRRLDAALRVSEIAKGSRP